MAFIQILCVLLAWYLCCTAASGPRRCNYTAEFDCLGDGTHCIQVDKVCDGNNDCGASEDERPKYCVNVTDTNPCQTNNGGCSQGCIKPKYNDHYCLCLRGYTLNPDNRTCTDTNECATLGVCSQTCFNLQASYVCVCAEGYIRAPTNHALCRASGDAPTLLLVEGEVLRELNLRTGNGSRIGSVNNTVSILDFDHSAERVYWLEATSGTIYSVLNTHPHGNQTPNVAVVTGSGNITAFSIDWIHKNLYWADYKVRSVSVTSLGGTRIQTTLIRGVGGVVHALVVDPRDTQGFMYWAAVDDQGYIEKGGMDGQQRSVIVRGRAMAPTALTIDYVQNRLYWADQRSHLIATCDLFGGRHLEIVTSHVGLPTGVAVFEEHVYWSDAVNTSVYKANKFNGSDLTPIFTGLESVITNIVVYHSLKQPNGTDRCGNYTGGCSHLCLPTPGGPSGLPTYTCVCPDHLQLDNAGRNCTTPDNSTTSTVTSIPTSSGIADTECVDPSGVNCSTTDGQEPSHRKPQGPSWRDILIIGGATGGATILSVIILTVVIIACKRHQRAHSAGYSPYASEQPGADLLRRVTMGDNRGDHKREKKSRFPLKPMTETPRDDVIDGLHGRDDL